MSANAARVPFVSQKLAAGPIFFYDAVMRLNIPFIKQKLIYTCGPTAMQMILKYFGKSVTDTTLCAMSGTNERHGTNRQNIVSAFKVLGFNVHAHHSSSVDELKFYLDKKVPVLVNYRHFVDNVGHYSVVVGFEKGNIVMHDPYGEPFLVASVKQFDESWYGLHSKQYTRWMVAVSDQPLPVYPEHIE